MQFTLKSSGPEETRKLAAEILEIVLKKQQTQSEESKPIVFLLSGELGAGKTQFTKGIADVLHVKKVKSPSYIYVNEHDIDSLLYPQIKRLIHIDAWRLNDAETARLIILPEYFTGANIVVIEWPEKLDDLEILDLKGTTKVEVNISSGAEPEERVFMIEAI
jgi:tRNA threonylcarbamoyl adenosine modification protein YjeE